MHKIFFYFLVLIAVTSFAQTTLKSQEKLQFEDYFFDAMNERLKANYDKSNDLFQQCLSIDPQNDVVYFKMAQNDMDAKKYEEALTYINKAKSINPDNKWYQKTFIEIKIAEGIPINKAKKLIEEFRPKAKNKYVVMDLYRKLFYGRQKTGLSVSYNSPKKNSALNLSPLINAQKYDEAIQKGEKYLEKHPNDAQVYYDVALAYKFLKKYQDALDYLDMGSDFILKNKALQKKYYQLYIDIYTVQGKKEKAMPYKQKLQKI